MAISSPITKSSFATPTLFKELKAINVVTLQINNEKKKRFALQKKLDNLTDKYGERTSYDERESDQENKQSGKSRGGRNIFKPVVSSLAGGLFEFFKVFLAFKALQWLANPKNKEAVFNIVKVLQGVFKFVNALVGFGVDNLLTGLSEVLGGDTILERISGIFKLVTGLFIVTRVLRYANIVNIFKDIGFIWNKRKVIARIFKQLGDKKFGEAIKNLFKLTFPKLSGLFRRGIGKTIQLTIRKVFGSGALKLVTGLAKKLGLKTVQGLVKTGLAKVAGSAAKGIPLVGPFIGLAINLLLGDSIDMALVKMAGAMAGQALGALAGGAIGALFAGVGAAPGAAIGAFLGNIVGDWLAGSLYGWIKSFFVKPKDPELAVGGIVTQPTRAIVGEAGPEAVVPLSKLSTGDIFEKPIKEMGAGLIGGMDAVITSMGPVGIMVRPFANQLFAPYTKSFGTDSYVFTSDLGKTSGAKVSLDDIQQGGDSKSLKKIIGSGTPKLLATKDSNPRARYNSGTGVLALLGDIYNGLVNLNFDSGTGPGSSGGSDDAPSGPTSTLVPEGGLSGLTDADWKELAFIVSGEAGPGDDRFGVAAVVLNRVASAAWPNTIREVGRQSGQFEAVEIGTARYDQKLADDLKKNQGKIASALKQLNGRDSFKGRSQYQNMGPGDIKFDARGNFYHYRQQHSKNDPPPQNPETNWKKWVKSASGGPRRPRRRQRNFGKDYKRQELMLSAIAAGGSGLADIRGSLRPQSIQSRIAAALSIPQKSQRELELGSINTDKNLTSTQKWTKANPVLAEVERLRDQQKAAGKSIYDKEFREKIINPVLYKTRTIEESQKLYPVSLPGTSLIAESTKMKANMATTPFSSDTYIIAPGTTVYSNTTVLSSTPVVDYSSTSYATLDTPLKPPFNSKL